MGEKKRFASVSHFAIYSRSFRCNGLFAVTSSFLVVQNVKVLYFNVFVVSVYIVFNLSAICQYYNRGISSEEFSAEWLMKECCKRGSWNCEGKMGIYFWGFFLLVKREKKNEIKNFFLIVTIA